MNNITAYDRAFGEHSNIPACCIDFYVKEWEYIWQQHNHPYVKLIRKSKANYVQCPKCLNENKIVKIKDCKKECGGDHFADFVPKEMSYGY